MDIKPPNQGWDHCQTIQGSDLCGHKQKTSLYVDIALQTIENPDVCGHKQQTSRYVDIKLSILSRHYYQTLKIPDACKHKEVD